MSLNQGWWDRPNTRHDRLQNDAIETLRSRLAAQSSSVRRQAAMARKATDRVAAEVARLEDRLDALVELTDLRFQLLEHHETNRVRNELDRRLSLLSRGGVPPEHPLDDIPGYWLPPVANLLLIKLRGGGEPVDELLELARERDRFRTDLFVLSAGIGFEVAELSRMTSGSLLSQPIHPDLVDPDLGLETPVPTAWRRLWIDAAGGGLGEPAREQLESRLAGAVSDLELADRLTQRVSHGGTSPLTDLRRLRERCQKVMASARTTGAGAIDTESWRGFLRELVEEGHAEEIDLRRRTGDLLRRFTEPSDQAPGGLWADTGSLGDLLAQDILDDSAPDAQAAVAMRVGADAVMLCTQRLWERTRKEAPDVRTVRVEGVSIKVTLQGVRAEDRQRVADRIDEHYQPGSSLWAWTAGVVGLVAAAILFIVIGATVLGVITVVAAAACLPSTISAWREPEKIAELRATRHEAADRRMSEVHQGVLKSRQEVLGTSQEAAGERDQILELFGAYSRRR
ncbi:hypothetical protein FB566_0319 [Stackebrandtia endophytica]|uniref:Uncharacterized protein n=1 Tax=Stackebrandtia endophytica TaxID=1496996 RepID=A0A543AQG0_9ACTN|nr:BCD family MFS transporter [Stackebrandtia endophytica]TQL74831.1 hypothetical protein FB566_0319 [Stackebrandtia endophytica]